MLGGLDATQMSSFREPDCANIAETLRPIKLDPFLIDSIKCEANGKHQTMYKLNSNLTKSTVPK